MYISPLIARWPVDLNNLKLPHLLFQTSSSPSLPYFYNNATISQLLKLQTKEIIFNSFTSHILLPSPKTISTMSFNVLSIPTAKSLTRPVLALVESSTIASLVVYSPSFFPLQSPKVHFPIKIPNHPISLFKSL